MPKDISERIIDSPFAPTTRGGSVSIGSGGGGGGGGGATTLDALTDVTLSSVSNGQTLSYNSGTGQWVNSAPAAMTAHALSGSFHTGLLNWSLINFSGSSLGDLATRSHSLLTGIGPDDHHNQQHLLATGTGLGPDHTISGAAAGEVLRALSATTAAFDVLHHTDLDNILPDQHHTRAHDIITGDASGPVHTVVGADFTVVGVHPTDTLALLPTSSAPGAAVSILKTDANGGIQLDTNLLYVDGANNRIGINRTPGGASLDVIAAANADHTQRIKMKSGQTGRLWRIEDLSGNELIVLDSVGDLQSGSPGFVSGLTGWQITPQGNAEFNNIWACGELHATVFVKDEVHATGGTLLVATAGTLHDDAVISSATVDDDVLVLYSTPAGQGVPLQVVTTSGTFVGNEIHVSWVGNFINVNDPPSGPGFYFQPGDIIRSKTEVPTGVTDFWLEVNSATQYSGYATYSITKRSGTDGTLPKGSAVVSYGREGDGRILLTSDLNYAPYIDVFTVGPNVWTGNAGSVLPRMRMGRLDGIGLPGVSGVTQYGMIAGQNLADANSGYMIASNLQFSLYKINIRLNNGTSDTGLWTADGNLSIGSNIGALATTGFQVITTGARSGDVVIGNEATGNFVRWQQATGILTVTGNLVITDPGTTVTKTYVDAQDSAYDALAVGYGSTAQGNATAYSDARRIVGVTGSWDSPTATTIRWGTKAVAGTPAGVAMSAAFGNNSNRVIADHAAASVSVTSRTYLFVSVAGTGTMTMTPTTSLATVMASVNNVLIAVADPGDATTKACSITVVAGSTYISGSNIFTGSIVAANIAAGSITTDKLVAGTITSSYLDPAYVSGVNSGISTAQSSANTAQSTANTANTAAGTAQTTANSASSAASSAQTAANNAQTDADAAAAAAAANKTYADQRRIIAVSGTWTVVNGNTISWTGLSARFASGGIRTITSQSNVAFSPAGRWYLYVDVGAGTGTMAMQTPTNALSSLGVDDVLIAVVDTSTAGPTPKASLNVVAGSTYISGGNIMTGSIVTTNIAAGAIDAGLINVTNLQAVATLTGALTVDSVITMGSGGNIQTSGKTGYADGTAGVFLGYEAAGVAGYKFGVGDTNSYVRWGGAGLPVEIKSAGGLSLTSAAGSPFNSLTFFRGVGGGVIRLYHDFDSNRTSRIRSDGIWTFDWEVYAQKFVQTGDTLQLTIPRTIAHNNSAGAVGEMCWEVDGTGHLWIYFCNAPNTWRRFEILPTSW